MRTCTRLTNPPKGRSWGGVSYIYTYAYIYTDILTQPSLSGKPWHLPRVPRLPEAFPASAANPQERGYLLVLRKGLGFRV